MTAAGKRVDPLSLTHASVQQAAARILGAVHRTPVLTSSTFDGWAQRSLFFKCENLQRVGILDKAYSRADALSGGQQQRVGIARALMQRPDVMLADEPVASLDPATSHSVMKYLEEINKKDGITVICSLHFLSLARRYGTRVIALKDGRVAFDGLPAEIDEARFKEIYGLDAVEVEIGVAKVRGEV